MDDRNFEEMCRGFEGKYDEKRKECILNYNSYSKMKELQEAIQGDSKLNIRDINSDRDTNLDSFDTFDEIFDENGTIAIRRPNKVIINNYGSIELY